MENLNSSDPKKRTASSTSSSSVTEYVNQVFENSELNLSEVVNIETSTEEYVHKNSSSSNDKEYGGESQSEDTFPGTLETSVLISPGFRKMYLAAFIVLQFAVCMGITGSYSATATENMKTPQSSIHPSTDQVTWIGSLMPIGALFGGTAGGYFSNSLGRKGTLMCNSLPFITGWLFIAYASSTGLIFIGRILTGFSTGIVSVATPMYLVEISTPDIRGLLGASFQLFVVIGILIVNSLGAGLNWRGLAISGAVMILIATFCMAPMPESPKWLISKNRRKEAKKAIIFLQGESYDAEGECVFLEEEIKKQPVGRIQLKELTVPTVYKPFILSILLMMFQQCSGINAILFYTVSIFNSAHVPLEGTTAAIIVAVVQVLATLLSSILMDRAGRKLLLLISGACMAISLYTFSGYALSVSKNKAIVESVGWLPVLCLTAYVAAFAIGFGPTPWLMVAEMTPSRFRSLVSGVSTALNWTFAFFVTKSFDSLNLGIKDYGVYALYGTFSLSSMIVTYFFLPETKGKEMNEIEDFFSKKSKK